jgi:hypothetical protein
MKDGYKQIVGKTISSVVVGSNRSRGSSFCLQMFLVFSDGTSLEFFGGDFNCASGLDSGGQSAAIKYIENCGGTITSVHPKRE